jgi:hypothetical protein
MLTKTQISLLVGIAVAVWAGSLFIQGEAISWKDAQPFTITVSAISAACFIFDRWAWRWRIFRGWLVEQPDLQGTWRVLLKSSWKNPETKEGIPPINCVMTIRQTNSKFSARLFTRESSSYLVAHKLEKQNDGVFQLFGTYHNTPDISLRGKRSEIHYGALVLEVRGDPPSSLSGHYWTDRNTNGSLELSDRIDTLIDSYKNGATAFGFEP